MRAKALLALASLLIGIAVGLTVPGLYGGSAVARKRTFTTRCVREAFNLTTSSAVLYNPGKKTANVTEFLIGSDGVVDFTNEFTIAPRNTTERNHADEFSVIRYTSSQKLLVDGYIFWEHPINADEDKLRQMRCF
jgi:hypothetical protein